jgi:hypothetical protein
LVFPSRLTHIRWSRSTSSCLAHCCHLDEPTSLPKVCPTTFFRSFLPSNVEESNRTMRIWEVSPRRFKMPCRVHGPYLYQNETDQYFTSGWVSIPTYGYKQFRLAVDPRWGIHKASRQSCNFAVLNTDVLPKVVKIESGLVPKTGPVLIPRACCVALEAKSKFFVVRGLRPRSTTSGTTDIRPHLFYCR